MELEYVAIRYEGDREAILKQLRPEEDMLDDFEAVYQKCLDIADPQGVFGQSEVRQEGGITYVDGRRFDSRVLEKNFRGAKAVYPYVVTCGRALYDLARETPDPLERYWVDTIAEFALRAVGRALNRRVREKFGLERIASVNPGSLSDFPLRCQRPLFDILGEGPARIGLELTPVFLMLPYKSGSGIYFEAQHTYENCMLCPKANCPGRRAPYSVDTVLAYELTVPDRIDIAACQTAARR